MTARTLAQAFVTRHSEFLFEDAHFLVEAAATVAAKEVAPNVFLFSDGSTLRILRDRMQTICLPAAVEAATAA